MTKVCSEKINNEISGDASIFRYALVVEYIGKDLKGSQYQPEQRTVQGELEHALSVLMKKDVKTYFAGRTDAGVNAKFQVVHFDSTELTTNKILYSLNSILPKDISISRLVKIDKDFHSQKSAKNKHYRYTINNASNRSVWDELGFHIRYDLDIAKMKEALSFLVGKHDFSAFRCPHTSNPSTICNLLKANCEKKENMIYFDFVGDRFLYNMIRIIIGSVIEIGRGVKDVFYLKNVLNSTDRTQAGPTAPAMGLTLMYIDYSEKYNMILNKEAINENLFCKAS